MRVVRGSFSAPAIAAVLVGDDAVELALHTLSDALALLLLLFLPQQLRYDALQDLMTT